MRSSIDDLGRLQNQLFVLHYDCLFQVPALAGSNNSSVTFHDFTGRTGREDIRVCFAQNIGRSHPKDVCGGGVEHDISACQVFDGDGVLGSTYDRFE